MTEILVCVESGIYRGFIEEEFLKLKLSEIAGKLGIKLVGNGNREITGVTSPQDAEPSKICVLWEKRIIPELDKSVPIMTREKYFDDDRDGLACELPRLKLAELLALFTKEVKVTGVDALAFVAENAVIAPSSHICAFSYIGENCEIGENTVIEPNAVILKDVKIGAGCIIHSGAVIGADGFGFERTDSGIVKIPQIGGVLIGDNVEIGACTTIDRGAMGNTEIGSGTKIDNHVQIGHNVKVGKNCIICSMSGVAGSSIIEDNVTISVQAGINDHVRVGAGTIIAGRAGVTSDIPAGSVISGFPARNHNDAKRALMLNADLPSIVKRLRTLERKVNEAYK